MSLETEGIAVQNPLIRYATDAGWTYLRPEEALCLYRDMGSPLTTRAPSKPVASMTPKTIWISIP